LRLLYRLDLLWLPPVLDRLLGVVVLSQLMALIWQWAAVFMRSDGYAVLANALCCHNLYRATWLIVKDRLWRLAPTESAELDDIGAYDRRVAGWFALVYVVGMIGVGYLFASFALPFLISMALWLTNNLGGLAIGSAGFWESIAILVILSIQWFAPPL